MTQHLRAAITAIGHYLPSEVLTNDDIAKMVDTSDEWITTRVGIHQRHILRDRTEGASVLGVEAVRDLVRRHPIDLSTIDMVICSTNSPDYIFPSTASIIAAEVGIPDGAPCYDFQAACSGFIFGLQIARGFIESGLYKRILLVTAEKNSYFANPSDRSTLPLFGDGGAATLIEPTEEEVGMIDLLIGNKNIGHRDDLIIPAGGSARPASHETIENGEHFIKMNGRVIFKCAVTTMGETSEEMLGRNGLSKDQVTWVVPHQANLRIMSAVAERLQLPMDRLLVNIGHCGNTSSSSIPIVLSECESRIRRGDNIVLTAFGAGLTYGTALLKWAYDTPGERE